MTNNNTSLLNTLVGTGSLKEEVRSMLQQELRAALQAELTAVLGYEKGDPLGWGTGNNRNGEYSRKIDTEFGRIEVAVPRDRNGEFKQHTLPRYDRRAKDVTDIIIELYSRGMSDREIASYTKQIYGNYYSPSTISDITKSLSKRAEAFHNRQFIFPYPFVFMDATYLNLRRDSVSKEALHVIMGITPDGHKEILDFALFPTESATNYESMLMNLKERGLTGVLLGVSDGLIGMEDMIKRVFPLADHQNCWVHLQRNIMRLVRQKDREAIANELKIVYTASSVKEAELQLEKFIKNNEHNYPKIRTFFSGKTNLFNFYNFPRSIWKTIYTTNLIESNNKNLKRRTKPKEQFPNEASLDRFVTIIYSRYNDKMSEQTHYGFKAAEYDLLNMIEQRYGEVSMEE